MVVLYFANQGKPFFLQRRPGKDGLIFRIIKFRTMNGKKDDSGNLLPDSQRLTKIGAFVRKTSIDELPQLINVVRGEMSLVGPRPLLPEYIVLYSQQQKQRHIVRPGITGWAQVNGRNAISWTKKLALDVEYVEKYNFLLDVKILFLTIKKVILVEGISQDGQVSIEPFDGNN